MSWTPATEDVLDAMKKGWPIADDAMNRWLAEVEQKAWNRGYLAGYSMGSLDASDTD